MDAALAGAKTLLLDREGWPISSLSSLEKGKVIFNDWPSLWKACDEYWHAPEGVPGFGDWSPILDELDPFRDGRAAERVSMYIGWILDGFRSGLGRKTVLADAASKYAKLWGSDKIKR
jgi:hypothetical protein